ncbi:MAG: hypothetical protein RLZZ04_3299 [Cyanobacteriota bacterium]
MSQFKNLNLANFSFFNIALLATIAYGIGSPRSEAISPPDLSDRQLPLIERGATLQNIQTNLGALSVLEKHETNKHETNVLLADNTAEVNDPDSTTESAPQTSSASLMRLLSLSFLLLFFVPLGIFYPLFLFYRRLLIKPDESDEADDILNSDRHEDLSEVLNSENPVLRPETDFNKATVSKLQIAFSPPASQLRQELNRVSGTAHLNLDDDLVDLMHKTVEVLIEQEHWTHVSYDSIALPLEKVEPEFDFISHQERNKFTHKAPSLLKYNRNINGNSGYQESYSYVVVTLILCTSHKTPLFQSIHTKQQLVEELMKLSKMEQDSVIRFELLWNPQKEDVYISNEQLLIEYADMTRLF